MGKTNENSVSGKKYKPFGLLNLFIGSLPIILGTVIGLLSEEIELVLMVEVVTIVVSFVLLFIRNLKCKNIFKTILFSIITIPFGILFLMALFAGWGSNPNKKSNGNSGGQQWSEQYSHSKGTYYTDGQGNFKDQYGNDVYNPQGVSDYDKL